MKKSKLPSTSALLLRRQDIRVLSGFAMSNVSGGDTASSNVLCNATKSWDGLCKQP